MLMAITRLDRQTVTAAVLDAINSADGWVEDVRIYSNIMTLVRFVIDAGRLPALVGQFGMIGLDVSEPRPGAASAQTGETITSLQITFVHNAPDLKIPVPPVPG